jgi:hypothetical protein
MAALGGNTPSFSGPGTAILDSEAMAGDPRGYSKRELERLNESKKAKSGKGKGKRGQEGREGKGKGKTGD